MKISPEVGDIAVPAASVRRTTELPCSSKAHPALEIPTPSNVISTGSAVVPPFTTILSVVVIAPDDAMDII